MRLGYRFDSVNYLLVGRLADRARDCRRDNPKTMQETLQCFISSFRKFTVHVSIQRHFVRRTESININSLVHSFHLTTSNVGAGTRSFSRGALLIESKWILLRKHTEREILFSAFNSFRMKYLLGLFLLIRIMSRHWGALTPQIGTAVGLWINIFICNNLVGQHTSSQKVALFRKLQ